MRIVTEAQLKQLPEGIVYSEYFSAGMAEQLCVKGETWKGDWVYTPLLGEIDAPDCARGADMFEEMERQGKEYPASFGECTRDGLFDHERLYLVYSGKDVCGLIEVLTKTLTPTNPA